MPGANRPVRRGGTGRLPDGGRITWTVADGRQGRRWRSGTLAPDGRLLASLLLEVAPDGSPGRLELATAAGLLTVHPDAATGTLHGNVLDRDGVRPVTVPWSGRSQLLVAGSPVTAAVAAARLGDRIGVGEGAAVPAVEVGTDLTVRSATWRVARAGPRRWLLVAADGGPVLAVDLDTDGIPAGLPGEEAWPLEAEGGEGSAPG